MAQNSEPVNKSYVVIAQMALRGDDPRTTLRRMDESRFPERDAPAVTPRGGVSVNYHTLADFRVAHRPILNDLLTQSITALLHRGVITMARVAQDGTRVRGSAGAASFGRRPRLEEALRAARKQVDRTARQEDGPGLSREAAAEARAARERLRGSKQPWRNCRRSRP
ncbi:MAG: hypothetical protein DMF89_10150 [Acidobacteria bacterium]|nr:MAG: hypothetical protein DMF89_10150 [Acidobacteriota bacterium]